MGEGKGVSETLGGGIKTKNTGAIHERVKIKTMAE